MATPAVAVRSLCVLLATTAVLLRPSGSQEPPVLAGVNMEQATQRLSDRFTGISINSLGVKALEQGYNAADFEFSTLEFDEIDAMLSNTSSANLINSITTLFDALSTTNISTPAPPPPPDCCDQAATQSVSCCFLCEASDQDLLGTISDGLSEPSLDEIQFYFGSREGTLVSSPTPAGSGANCTPFDARLQQWFIDATRSTRSREVVLMLDFTTFNTFTQDVDFDRLREAASLVLSSLTPLDKVGMVAVDGTPFAPPLFTGTTVVPVCQYIKDSLNGFVRVFQPTSSLPDYIRSYNLAFNMFTNDTNADKLVLYFASISLLSDATAIVQRHAELGGTIILNSYIINTPSPVQQLANSLPSSRAKVTVLNRGSSQPLAHFVGDYYFQLLTSLPSSSAITFGHQLDPSGANSLTITRPFFDDSDELVGVFHAMLPWRHLFGHITPSLVNRESSYFFVTRGDHRVLFHPLLPGDSQSDVLVTDVETDSALVAIFSTVQSNLTATHLMAATVEILLSHASDDLNSFVSRSLAATYYCRDVGVDTGLRLQACFVLANEDATVGTLDEESVVLADFPAVGDLVYHNLGMTTASDDQCNYFCKPTVTDRISYQLVEASLPSEADSPELVGQLSSYLSSGLASDRPAGVGVGVATEVALGSVVTPYWINDASVNNDFITRRHLATPHGVYLTYPPTQLVREFTPTRTEWYTASSTLPSSVILTPPYLNPLREGGHFSVSIGYSIRSPTDESDQDLSEGGRVLSVAAADLTLDSLRVFVEEASPFCRSPDITCFIVDNVGNLVYHPALLEAGRDLEAVPHFFSRPLTNTASLSENRAILYDLLMRDFADTPLQKLQCVDLFDTIVARRVFFAFNLSFEEATFSNLVQRPGARALCALYSLRRIPETNTFLVAVQQRSTCPGAIICFCPEDDTSTCVNENFQQNSCECPCTRNDNCNPIRNVPACPPISFTDPNLRAAPGTIITDVIEANDHPPFCFNQECDCYTQSSTCSGASECFWCEEQNTCVHVTECCDSQNGISCCADSERFEGLTDTLGCLEVSCAQNSGASPFPASVCPTDPPFSPDTSRLSGGAITGIVVGVIAGILILVALIIFCVWYQYFRKIDPQEETSRESAFDFSQKRMESMNPRAVKEKKAITLSSSPSKGDSVVGGGSGGGGGGGEVINMSSEDTF